MLQSISLLLALCHEYRRSTRRYATVREMKEGPFEVGNRVLISSHRKLLWSKATVVNVAEKSGSCTERENLAGDAKGKGANGSNREAESTHAPSRGGLLRSSDEAGVMPAERRERAIAIWLGSTGNGKNPMFNGRRQPSCGGTSRMTRECQVRMCVQVRLACSAGDSPARVEVRAP